MSKHITFQGPFVKKFHANNAGLGTRATGNPALPEVYANPVPSPLRRVYLLIQNKGATQVTLTMSGAGNGLILYAGQSISFDNYNGGFDISSYTDIVVIEAFA